MSTDTELLRTYITAIWRCYKRKTLTARETAKRWFHTPAPALLLTLGARSPGTPEPANTHRPQANPGLQEHRRRNVFVQLRILGTESDLSQHVFKELHCHSSIKTKIPKNSCCWEKIKSSISILSLQIRKSSGKRHFSNSNNPVTLCIMSTILKSSWVSLEEIVAQKTLNVFDFTHAASGSENKTFFF